MARPCSWPQEKVIAIRLPFYKWRILTVLTAARYSPVKMIETLVSHRVTNCIFTPTQVKVMLNAPNKKTLLQWIDLRSLVLGGESVSPLLVRDFFALKLPQARFFNGYAPSETTVVNTMKE